MSDYCGYFVGSLVHAPPAAGFLPRPAVGGLPRPAAGDVAGASSSWPAFTAAVCLPFGAASFNTAAVCLPYGAASVK